MSTAYQFVRFTGEFIFESFQNTPEDDLRWSIVRRGIKSPNSIPTDNS